MFSFVSFCLVLFVFVLFVLVSFVFVLFIFVLFGSVWIQCNIFKKLTPSLVLLTIVSKMPNVYVNSVIMLLTTNHVHLIP